MITHEKTILFLQDDFFGPPPSFYSPLKVCFFRWAEDEEIGLHVCKLTAKCAAGEGPVRRGLPLFSRSGNSALNFFFFRALVFASRKQRKRSGRKGKCGNAQSNEEKGLENSPKFDVFCAHLQSPALSAFWRRHAL